MKTIIYLFCALIYLHSFTAISMNNSEDKPAPINNKKNPVKKHKIACKHCSKKHHKCDKKFPTCHNCTRLKIPCEESKTKKRGRPFGSTNKIEKPLEKNTAKKHLVDFKSNNNRVQHINEMHINNNKTSTINNIQIHDNNYALNYHHNIELDNIETVIESWDKD